MKYLMFLVSLFLFFSCKKDRDPYPILYTLDHVVQDDALYRVDNATTVSDLPVNTGLYGPNRDSLKQEMKDLLKIAFDLREIELLNEDTLRILLFVEDQEIDTVFTYSKIDGEIVIDSAEDIIVYDKSDDHFEVCGVLTLALPGPNVVNPGNEYNQYSVVPCTPGFSLKDYAINALIENSYEPLDTIAIITTRYIYK